MKKLLNQFLKGGNYLFEHRTGGGKTTLAMALALVLGYQYNKKVFFYTRTHLHMNEIYSHIHKIANRYSLSVIPLLGKEILCPYSPLYPDLYNACFHLRKRGNCLIYNNLKNSSNALSVLKNEHKDIDDLVSNILLKGFCPYYLLYGATSNSNIIIAPYYHIFYPPRYVSIKPLQYAIIIDEFHNLPFYYPNLRVYKIESEELENALFHIKKFYKHTDLIESAINKLIYCNMNEITNANEIRLISRAIKSLAFTIKNFYITYCEDPNYLYPNLVRLTEFGVNNLHYIKIENGTIFLYYKYNRKILRNFFRFSFLNLFISATLSPPELFKRFIKRVFGLSNVVFIDLVEPSSNLVKINIYLIKGYTSLYFKRSKTLYESLASMLFYLTKRFGDLVVFIVSKDFSNRLYNELQRKLPYNNFVVFNSFSGVELSNKNPNLKKILLLTHRGSFSEGINLLRNLNINNVVIAGLPLPPPSSQIALHTYLSYGYKEREKIFKYGYVHPALISVIQAIGRLLTFKDSRINVFVFEDRLKKYLFSKFVPRWFKSSIVIKEMVLDGE